MLSLGIIDGLLVFGLGLAGALFICTLVWGVSKTSLRARKKRTLQSFQPTILFDGEEIVDATEDTRALISSAPSQMSDLQATLFTFHDRFPTLGERLLDLQENQTLRVLPADSTPIWIELSKKEGLIKLSLHGSGKITTEEPSDQTVQYTTRSELELLRNIAEFTPQQIWQQDEKGQLVWANHAYLATSDYLLNASANSVSTWPERPIFEDLHFDVPDTGLVKRRLSVGLPDNDVDSWFDITSVQYGKTTLHFATDANGAVLTEQSRNRLMQTLCKTFAHLSIGLAIFDHKRQLTIFNPALLDLTGATADFLSSRPTLNMFLDYLRDEQLLPEPKNYTSWREQFNALEEAARGGKYCENWNLPDGMTYRVTGKPHSDGAIAIFFEDISAQVSLARQSRSDIETGQSVLDSLSDAIAVFSTNGTLVIFNKAYENLWGPTGTNQIERQDIQQELAIWRSRCAVSPVWSGLRNFIGSSGERELWEDLAVLDDGRQIDCTAKPVASGMTMVTFTFAQRTRPIVQMLTRPDPSLMFHKR